jgi:hypothetical protein
MKHYLALVLTLAACAVVDAAEPIAVAPAVKPAPAAPTPKADIRKPLDLRIGDVRKYMMPNEFREAIDAPDADRNTVVVEGKQELLPVKYEKPIPTWPLGPLYWGLMNPANSWRILLPDINRGPLGPPDVVPPPIFRWGP